MYTIDIKKDYSRNESVSNIMEAIVFTDITSRGVGASKVSEIIPYMGLIATEKGHKLNRLSDFEEVKSKLIRQIQQN